MSRRKWITPTIRAPPARLAPDRVQRHFYADAPDRLWVADITSGPTWVGFVFLAVVLDAFSRKGVGWARAHHLRPERVTQALNMALGPRHPVDVCIIPIKDRSTPRLLSAHAASKPVSDPRWDRWAIVLSAKPGLGP